MTTTMTAIKSRVINIVELDTDWLMYTLSEVRGRGYNIGFKISN